jgi:hypothetical protein
MKIKWIYRFKGDNMGLKEVLDNIGDRLNKLEEIVRELEDRLDNQNVINVSLKKHIIHVQKHAQIEQKVDNFEGDGSEENDSEDEEIDQTVLDFFSAIFKKYDEMLLGKQKTTKEDFKKDLDSLFDSIIYSSKWDEDSIEKREKFIEKWSP